MPHVLISSLKAAEPDGDAEQSLAPPQVAGSDGGFPQLQRLGGVNQHLHWFLHTGLQQVFQGVVVLVLQEQRGWGGGGGEGGGQQLSVTATHTSHCERFYLPAWCC